MDSRVVFMNKAKEIEKIIKNELLINRWDDNQFLEGNKYFNSAIHADALRVNHILSLLEGTTGEDSITRQFDVLEIGIGYGYVVVPLHRYFPKARICAIELPERDSLKKWSFNQIIGKSDLRLIPHDITSGMLPFEDRSFDFVVFSEIIEHISPAIIMKVLGEIYRTLKNGGIIIVTTPNVLRLRNRVRFFMGKRIFASPIKENGQSFGHLREYTEREIVEMLSNVGLETDISNMNISYPVPPALTEKTITQAGKLLSVFSPKFRDFICICGIKNH